MAVQSDKISQMPPSIATILRNLSSRPNVQSTLIISRQDGSIISATGPASQGSMPARAAAIPYQRPELEDKGEGSTQSLQGGDLNSQPDYNNQEPTYTEKLAACIVQFVDVATIVAQNLDVSQPDDSIRKPEYAQPTGSTEGRDHNPRGDDEESSRKKDQEVQLLRMRTKRQEIIIFPDASYLCCVVQDVGKHGNSA